MNDLLMAEATLARTRLYLDKPSHALLIVGPVGIGKFTIAKYIASELLGLSPNKIEQYPYFSVLVPQNGVISIDQVRQLSNFIMLKTTGKPTIRRIIIVDKADLMTIEAQNALLKILEEPPTDTVLILTTPHQSRIRPTIVSRCQILQVNKPNFAMSSEYFMAKGVNEVDIASKYLFANGSPGSMFELLNTDSKSDSTNLVGDAKDTLRESSFNRLIKVDEIIKDRESLTDWLFALKQVCRAALIQAVEKGQLKLIKHWLNCLKSILSSESDLNRGGNLKLIITKLLTDLEYN